MSSPFSSSFQDAQDDARATATSTDATTQLTSYREGMRKREINDSVWKEKRQVEVDQQDDEFADHLPTEEELDSMQTQEEHIHTQIESPETTQEEATTQDYDPYHRTDAAQGKEREESDLAICRICLEGPGDASSTRERESLGRLLSPCRCKGTMKYVHARCLDSWRALSSRTSSIVACDQCGQPYRFRKSRFVGLATSPSLLFTLSVFLFLLLIWTTGLVASLVLKRYDTSLFPSSSHSDVSVTTEGNGAWSAWLTGDEERGEWEEEDAYTVGYGGGWGWGWGWGYENVYSEPVAYVRLVREAVRQFATGEAGEAVKGLVGLEAGQEQMEDNGATQKALKKQEGEEDQGKEEGEEEDENDPSFWSALNWEWKYGKGGFWPDHQPTDDQRLGEGNENKRSTTSTTERYDARKVSSDRQARRIRRSSPSSSKSKSSTRGAGWLDAILLQFSLGFSLIGILSFLNIILGFGFLGPFNLNFGLGRIFARLTGGGGGGRRNRPAGVGREEGVNIASILVVLLVVIGVVRALLVVYKVVKKLTRRMLGRLEEVVVDLYGEEEEREEEGAQMGRVMESLQRQRERRHDWQMARGGD